jgi:dihydroorotate dehydrogenase (NAD+) catalytic subunit
MDRHAGEFVVVEARAPHATFLQREANGPHEVQPAAGVRAQADDIAGVPGNLWLVQDDVEHLRPRAGRSRLYNARVAPTTSTVPGSLALNFCGLPFASPIVLLSGCVGFGEEYTRIEGFSNRDVGAVVLKGTTGGPRLGNPPHRLAETPAGMLNAIGLQNPGAAVVVRDILPTLDFTETRFIANVSGSTLEEYVEVTRRFDDSAIDAIEINISCPNVKEGGVQFGNYPDMSARVVAACRAVTKKPLITKLSPNQTDIQENARRCIDAGSDALAVINTVTGMAIDVTTRTAILGNGQGGLSGAAIKPIALLKVRQVWEVANRHGVPIIGQGGITGPEDALEFLIAGATAVGVGTALFYEPLICQRINAGIAEYLRGAGLAAVGELTGTLRE